MNVGIVGLGKMGILHGVIINALEGCGVTAVCEKEGLLLGFARKLLPSVSFYSDVSSMVKEEKLDAVFVTTPIATHSHIFRDVVNSNSKTAVFVEKPLASSCLEASEMRSLANKQGVITMVGYQKRFAFSFSRAKESIESGSIGDPLTFKAYSFVSSVFKESSGWRFRKGEGGALIDLGSHLLDLILYYFGSPEWVFAYQKQFYSKEVDDFTHTVIGYRNGLTGYVDVSWSVEGFRLPETRIEVMGSEGRLEVTDDRFFITKEKSRSGEGDSTELTAPELYKGVDFLVGDPEYCIQDKYFLHNANAGNKCQSDFEEASHVNRIIELMHKSAQERKVVWLDDEV